MLETQLPPASASEVWTHTSFLDECYEKGLYVLVGIPLPQSMFVRGSTVSPSESWWTDNLKATVAQLASHPAVMGFTIANEVDNGSVSTYGPEADAKYWWAQVEAMAKIAKKAAPDKLVGIANHDDPGICQNCQTYMAQCSSIDFWGVNSYQPDSFSSVFGTPAGNPVGYTSLTGSALKPVILTEYGFPSTSRKTADTLNPAAIYSDSTTQKNVATVLDTMLPKAFAESLNLGVAYFEYCDEWWNQSGYSIAAGQTCPVSSGPNAPDGGAGGNFQPPNVYTQYGGPIACGFPNYYWDNDGFGAYSVAVGKQRAPAQPWDPTTNAPALPLDTRSPRQPVIDAIKRCYAGE